MRWAGHAERLKPEGQEYLDTEADHSYPSINMIQNAWNLVYDPCKPLRRGPQKQGQD